MDIIEILKKAIEQKVSDVFIISGTAVSFKSGDGVQKISEGFLMPEDTERYIKEIYKLGGNRSLELLLIKGDDDFSFSIPHLGRFRCNAYKQRGSLCAVIRVVAFKLPDYSTIGIPETVIDLYKKNKGLVLFTGAAGSGKSTTLSCIVDKINTNFYKHIITIEDPIEFLHRHNKSVVSQREVDHDTESYISALRSALRQAPDVILLGEMRDLETITAAMTAAETGQLVLSTLHTMGASSTIDRIIDVFEANQQKQIRIQLSMVLQAVISQKLIPSTNGGVVPAFEIMIVNNAIRNMIRESKVHQIDNAIFSGGSENMVSMDSYIMKLYNDGLITKENAIRHAVNTDIMQQRLGNI